MRPRRGSAATWGLSGPRTGYAIALRVTTWRIFRDAPALALEMGHTSPRMIFDHYREVVSPEAARRFWGIRAMNAEDEAALRETALRDAKNAEDEAALREFALRTARFRLWEDLLIKHGSRNEPVVALANCNAGRGRQNRGPGGIG